MNLINQLERKNFRKVYEEEKQVIMFNNKVEILLSVIDDNIRYISPYNFNMTNLDRVLINPKDIETATLDINIQTSLEDSIISLEIEEKINNGQPVSDEEIRKYLITKRNNEAFLTKKYENINLIRENKINKMPNEVQTFLEKYTSKKAKTLRK